MEQKHIRLRELCSQWISGAINGSIFGGLISLIYNGMAYAELWMRGLLENSHVVTVWMPILKTIILCIFVVGMARGAYYAFLKNTKNTILAWQVTGVLSIVLFYLGFLFSNIYSSIFSPQTFQWRFSESTDVGMWIIVLIVIPVFNLFYAKALHFIDERQENN